MLRTGSDWLEDQRHAHLTRTVEYHRGAESVGLKATVGKTPFEVVSEFGVEKTESRDFLIRTQDLVLGGQPTEPQRGDRVREAIGGEVVVFEVMAPGQEPVWQYSDPNRKTMRVHTKHVATEQP